jgi:hypothetical protein
MATQSELDKATQELAAKTQAAEGERIAYQWMKDHIHEFDPTPENSAVIKDYLSKNNMSFTYLNLEQAFLICKSQGHRFKKGMPSPGQQSEDGLPPVPAYMLAVNPLKTKKDVDALSPADYRKFYSGPDGFAFRKRVEFVSNKRG